MKINRNQKSVLTLFAIAFVGLLSGGGNVLSGTAIIVWIALGLWFYGVRDKNKSN